MHIPLQVKPSPSTGFTLIEISIVLVIIGLIVGGILTGQNLINAAAIRAQISQIEKYNTAVNTFRGKYGHLPGDIPDPDATQFGFQSRGQYAGEGDGNGVLEGNCGNQADWNSSVQQGCGELAVFWQDLSTAGLIDAHIGIGTNYPNISSPSLGVNLNSTPSVKDWLPTAKLEQGNFVYVMSLNGTNYFVVQLVNNIGYDVESTGNVGAGANAITVQQAYNIDKKIDDGLPQSGNVTACGDDFDVYQALGGYPTYIAAWAAGKGLAGAGGANCTPTTTATPPLSTDCYGNNNTTGTMTYSVKTNANLQNCALSFKFQ